MKIVATTSSVITKITSKLAQNHDLVIGIAGGSGSGKSYLSEKLKESLARHDLDVLIINQDDFCLGKKFKNRHNSKYKWDDPANYRLDECLVALSNLRKGEPATYSAYNLIDHEPAKLKTIKPSTNSRQRIIILEGILAWYGPLNNHIDYKIYLEANFYKRFVLRAYRNVVKIGNVDLNKTIEQFFSHVMLAEIDILSKLKIEADDIVERDVPLNDLIKPEDVAVSRPSGSSTIYKEGELDIFTYAKNKDEYICIAIKNKQLFNTKLTKANTKLLEIHSGETIKPPKSSW